MYSWMFLKAKLWVNDQEIMVMSNQEPIYVSDGQRHKIVVTLGKVEDNILKSNTVVLTVDGKHAEMEVSFWDKDGLEAMDPFLGGLPPENYQPYTGQYYLFLFLLYIYICVDVHEYINIQMKRLDSYKNNFF